MHRSIAILLTALLVLGGVAACSSVGFGLSYGRQGRYYFNDLPYGFEPYDGYWHRNHCWYDGYWYHEGRNTPYWNDFVYGDPYFW
ncbi:hypothetical protein IT575_04140 [bacterium]|nr:hypothetical protein [bacterium]